MPKAYWSYAAAHAVYLINRLPSVILNNKSLYELLHKLPPTYLDLKIFGSLSFASSLENNRTKLEPRARKCVFIGYKTRIKGYVLLDTNKREIFISRNVTFYEKVVPYKAFTELSYDNQNFDKNLDQNSFDVLLEPLHHTINKDDITENANETENNADIDLNEN